MSKIKLLKVDVLEDGTERFQSQLSVGKDSVDFVRGKDGIMRNYGWRSDKGFGFFEFNEPFEIVENKKDMLVQAL